MKNLYVALVISLMSFIISCVKKNDPTPKQNFAPWVTLEGIKRVLTDEATITIKIQSLGTDPIINMG